MKNLVILFSLNGKVEKLFNGCHKERNENENIMESQRFKVEKFYF